LKKKANKALSQQAESKNDEVEKGGKSIPVPLKLLKEVQLDDEVSSALLGGEGGLNADDVMDEIDLLGKERLIRSKVIKMPLIEREHVQQLYDAIAPNWHGTRYKAWPQVEAFIEVMCV
jgi:hypothetical protein